MVIVVILVLFRFALLCFWSIHCTYRYVLYRLYKLIEHTSDLTSFDSLNVACELNAGKTGFLFTFYMDVRNIKLRGWLQNPKHDRISIRRIRMLPFFFNSMYDSIAYVLPRPRLSESGAEVEEQAHHNAWNWALWFVSSSASASVSDSVRKMQFSLDHKWQSLKQNQCSVSDSIKILVWFSLNHIALYMYFWLENLNEAPSLVKTSLQRQWFKCDVFKCDIIDFQLYVSSIS